MIRTFLPNVMLLSILTGAAAFLPACDQKEAASERAVARDAAAAIGGRPDLAPHGPAATQPAATQPGSAAETTGMAASQPASGAKHGLRASPWAEPKDRGAANLDYTMTDQDGHAVRFEDLKGRPIVISFMFTRCPNPNMCPLIVARMAGLQSELAKAGLGGKVHLLLITYDLEHDTPEALKKFGADHGLHFENAMMLRPEADSFAAFLTDYQVGVTYHVDGSIGHFIELLLLDKQGRWARDYQGAIWENGPVMEDVRRLVAEE